MAKPFISDIDMNGRQIQNPVAHKVATTPAGVRAGQFWFNTSDNYLYYYNGTSSVAIGYLPPATAAALGGVKIGDNISVDGNGTISVASASNSGAGVIKIATDAEITSGTSTTVAVTPAQLASAIATANLGSMVYKGTWDITSATDFSGITLPVKKGYYYRVSGTGPKTIGGVEWNAGDHIVIEADVAAGGTITQISKVDNTEASDIVRLDGTQTLTNKTISAGSNTISGLGTGNFASGSLSTSIDSTGSDSKLPTEKAVRAAITSATDSMVTTSATQTLTNKTIDADDNTIQDLAVANFKSGVVKTSVRASGSASDDCLATEKAIAAAVEALPHKIVVSNPALTASSGLCTWSISNTIGSDEVVCSVREVSTGNEVMCDVTYGSNTIVIKINSSSNISASVYKAVIVG